MKCAVFYKDSVFEGEPHEIVDPVGVQGIVYDDLPSSYDTGRVMISGYDYYLLEGEFWIGVNGTPDLVDHFLYVTPSKMLKGRMLNKAEWQAVLARMKAHPGFRERSAGDNGFENGRYRDTAS